MNNLTDLNTWKNEKLANAFEAAAAMARNGDLSGAVIVFHFGKNDHRVGVFGDYRTDSTAALSATLLMEKKIRLDIPKYGS